MKFIVSFFLFLSLFALELHTKTTHYNMKSVFFLFCSVEQLFYERVFLLRSLQLFTTLWTPLKWNLLWVARTFVPLCISIANHLLFPLNSVFNYFAIESSLFSLNQQSRNLKRKTFFFNSQTARDFRIDFTRSESKTFLEVARRQTDENCQDFRWEDRGWTSKAERIIARGKVEGKLDSLSKFPAMRVSKLRRHSFSLIFHPFSGSKISPHHENPRRLSENLFRTSFN